MKMHLLSGGRLRMRRGIYYRDAARDETVELPVSCTLLKHPQGLSVVRHRLPSVGADRRRSPLGVARPVHDTDLRRTGHGDQPVAAGRPRTGDIDVVVCSHLHPDHCGCNVFFPRPPSWPTPPKSPPLGHANAASQGYLAIEWDLPNRIELIDGDRDLFGDGRITLLPMPGHTPGMLAAHVVLDRDGAFVLASDAVAVGEHLEKRLRAEEHLERRSGAGLARSHRAAATGRRHGGFWP